MIFLASHSKIRAELLKNAGVEFLTQPSGLDERQLETLFAKEKMELADVALILAQAKATTVSEKNPSAFIIGADQVMEFRDAGKTVQINKAASMEEARQNLLRLRRKTHRLYSAVSCVLEGEIVFNHVDHADLTMRDLSPEEIGRYLANVGDIALKSVGCYQLEGLGVQLFEKIDGNFHTILGLPLLPLLKELRGRGLISL